ncbi:MAG: hypothetical protein HQ478_12645, partial [Chloroflexi bacterium]|nr:hypothetical protein [Chloroflexota bacterium]
LSIVTAVSSIFDEQVALSGIVDANSIFNPNKTGNENNNTSNGDPSRNASLTGSGKKKGDGDDEDVADDGDDESAAGEDTDVSESREKALSQILAAWLNFAKGSVDWTEMIDTTGDGTPDTEFGVLIAEVETIMNNPGATKADLERAKDLAEAVNQHDKGNPDCDTVTGGGDESKADTKADDDASGAGDDDEKKDDEGGKSKKSEKKGKK